MIWTLIKDVCKQNKFIFSEDVGTIEVYGIMLYYSPYFLQFIFYLLYLSISVIKVYCFYLFYSQFYFVIFCIFVGFLTWTHTSLNLLYYDNKSWYFDRFVWAVISPSPTTCLN